MDAARRTAELVQSAEEELQADPAAEPEVGEHRTRADLQGVHGDLDGRGVASVEDPAHEPAERPPRMAQLPGEGARRPVA